MIVSLILTYTFTRLIYIGLHTLKNRRGRERFYRDKSKTNFLSEEKDALSVLRGRNKINGEGQ